MNGARSNKVLNKQNISVKALFSLFSFVGYFVLIKTCYFVFEIGYLAELGVGPEFFSRPLFSSNLVLAWLGTLTILPLLKVALWTAMVALSPVVLYLCFGYLFSFKFLSPEEKRSDENISGYSSETVKYILSFLVMVFVVCLVVILIFFGLRYYFNEARDLASRQIDSYLEAGRCVDTIDDAHVGCYRMSFTPDSPVLLIAKYEDTVVYLTKSNPQNGCATCIAGEVPAWIVAYDKSTGDFISREYEKRTE